MSGSWQGLKHIAPTPVNVEKDSDGQFLITFPDSPEAATDGEPLAEALAEANDCVEEALAIRIVQGEDIPLPSSASGLPVALPGAVMAAKTALYEALRKDGSSKSDLARAMGIPERDVGRMLDPKRATPIGRLEEALANCGRQLVVAVQRTR